MNIREIRRQNLLRLISGLGSVKALAERSGTNPDWLSALASENPPKTDKGTPRGIGSNLARKLEKGAQKPEGWMDQAHNYTEEQRMWMDLFVRLDEDSQKKAVEYLRLLDRASENPPENPPKKSDNQKP